MSATPVPAAPQPGQTAWLWRLFIVLALIGLVCAIFWPATGYDFVNFDDDRYVAANPAVQEGLSIANIRWAFTTVYEDWWLPMLWLSYMADTDVWGTQAFGYHLTNILLHAANAALLFWVLLRMTGSRWRSLFVAALFAVHPLRVESVAWIAARKDVLSGFFLLLGWLAYLRYVDRPSVARWMGLPAFMVLGLMSKAIAIIFPVALLLLDYWPLRRANALWGRGFWRQWRPLLAEKLPLFALAIVFALVNLHTHQTGSKDYTTLPLLDRLSLIAPNYWTYLRQIFWPAHLSILHPENDAVNWPASLLALAGLVLLTGLFLGLRKKRPYLLVGWMGFLLALFPVIRGVRFGLAGFADRFTYLPSIGLAVALTWAAADLLARWRGLRAALALVLLAACVARTRAALPDWKDSMAVFGQAIRGAPDHAMVNNNYGLSLLEAGQLQEALPHFEKAVANDHGITMFSANLGMNLVLLDRTDEAILRMERTRQKLNPGCKLLNFNLGLAWMKKAEPEKAIAYFRRAVDNAPDRPAWRAQLARAYGEAGQLEAFSNEMNRLAADGFPELAGDFDGLRFYYLGLWQKGEGPRAWAFFRRDLDRNPDNVSLLNNVAWLLATLPVDGVDPGEALRLARKALELSGDDNPSVLDTLAIAFAADRQFEEAVHWADKAHALAESGGQADLAGEIALRLDAYRSGRAWGQDGPREP